MDTARNEKGCYYEKSLEIYACLFSSLGDGTLRRNSADTESGDFNGDGKAGITDVIALLLAARSNPQDPGVDYNGDGAYSVSDAIALLLDIIHGEC